MWRAYPSGKRGPKSNKLAFGIAKSIENIKPSNPKTIQVIRRKAIKVIGIGAKILGQVEKSCIINTWIIEQAKATNVKL
jgi:hypothetical protein